VDYSSRRALARYTVECVETYEKLKNTMDQIQEGPDLGAAKGWKLVTAHHHGMARVSICIGRPPDLHRVEIEIAY
jgi:hypothetical protein